MKKLLVSIAVVLFLGCAASAAQPKISLDRINTSQPFPSITMDDGANITMNGGSVSGNIPHGVPYITISIVGSYTIATHANGTILYNSTDSRSVIQDSLDLTDTDDGGIVCLSRGHFDCDGELDIKRSSLVGSIGTYLHFDSGSHGLNISYQNGYVNQYIGGFILMGTGSGCGTSGKYGIYFPGGDAITDRTSGVVIDHIFFTHWDTAVYIRNMWSSKLSNCVGHYLNNGIVIAGKTIKFVIEDVSFVCMSGTGVGLNVIESDYLGVSKRPEDLRVSGLYTCYFDYGINWTSSLYGVIENCDIDFCDHIGISIQDASATMVVKDCWIGLTGSATYGIYADDATSMLDGTLDIHHNTISSSEANTANSRGIHVGEYHTCPVIKSNYISGSGQMDISVVGADSPIIEGNWCATSGTGIYSIYMRELTGYVSVANNHVESFLRTYPTNPAQFHFGPTSGHQSTYLTGAITMPSGTTTNTMLFSSLAGTPPNFIANSSTLMYEKIQILGTNVDCGDIIASCNQTGINVTCDAAPASDATIRWEVVAVASTGT